MQTNPNDGSNDNPDEFSEFRDPQHPNNIKSGEQNADQPMKQAQQPDPAAAQAEAGSPHYGDFGHKSTELVDDQPAGTNPGGTAAPTTEDPNQQGGAAQNLDTADVIAKQDEDEEDRHMAYKADDPRYGGGTSNWPTNEPANRTKEGLKPEDNIL